MEPAFSIIEGHLSILIVHINPNPWSAAEFGSLVRGSVHACRFSGLLQIVQYPVWQYPPFSLCWYFNLPVVSPSGESLDPYCLMNCCLSNCWRLSHCCRGASCNSYTFSLSSDTYSQGLRELESRCTSTGTTQQISLIYYQMITIIY